MCAAHTTAPVLSWQLRPLNFALANEANRSAWISRALAQVKRGHDGIVFDYESPQEKGSAEGQPTPISSARPVRHFTPRTELPNFYVRRVEPGRY